MKVPSILLVFLLFLSQLAIGQQTDFSYEKSRKFLAEPTRISFAQTEQEMLVQVKKVHSSHGKKIDIQRRTVDNQAAAQRSNQGKTTAHKRKTFEPKVTAQFQANFTNGTPADNNMAISNDGILITAVNSNVRFYDESGELLGFKTLASIARDVGNFTSSAFDPHTLYDPKEDRFILIFLSGYSSNNTNMIVGFSTTNDPMDDWNFYKLPGNVHGDKTWSDYPFMGVSDEELFIPVLLWKNGESGWDSEAQDILWQIDKKKGYGGEALDYQYFDKLKYDGKLIWNTRPVWGAETSYGPSMYFVANRAIDVKNDTFFLIEVTNTLASGEAELKIKAVQSDVAYGIPPSAMQPRVGDSLRTNYADVHGAFLHQGHIHLVANSYAWETNRAGIYYGIISDLQSKEPNMSAKIFSIDSLDLNYPNISYAGGGIGDPSCMINCLHSSKTTFPGSSVFFVDRNSEFSELKIIKEGEGYINVLSGDQERWGDYTGAQRKYNEKGVCWFLGSYGSINNGHYSWVARVENTDPFVGNFQRKEVKPSVSLYPNPSQQHLNIKTNQLSEGSYSVSIYSSAGQLIKSLGEELLGDGQYVFTLEISSLAVGSYVLHLSKVGSDLSEKLTFIKR